MQDWVFGSAVPANPEPKFRLEVRGEAQAGYPLLTDNGAPPGLIEMRNVPAASAGRKVVGAEDLSAIRLSRDLDHFGKESSLETLYGRSRADPSPQHPAVRITEPRR